MLTDDNIRQEISSAGRDSDIHGLINKIANSLHIRNPANSPESDWFMAQTILLKWKDNIHRKELCEGPSFGGNITKLLNHYAFLAYNNDRPYPHKRSSFDYWMQAQNELAEQVIWQTCWD